MEIVNLVVENGVGNGFFPKKVVRMGKKIYLCHKSKTFLLMKTVRTFMIAVLAMVSSAAFADGFEYLVVEQDNGATAQTALASFDQIRFENGKMVIYNGDTAMVVYSLSSLKKMYFSEGAAGILQMEDDSASAIEVYTASGVLMKQGNADLNGLPHGLYIIKKGDRVFKVKK